MDGKLKFSIIVPVYKVEAYIGDCVRSVLGQSYGEFELILVDDGSPDRSGELCDEWAAKDSRVIALHKPNGGQLSSRCFGIKRASGDYYMFLDSDDTMADGALELLHNRLSATDCDCIIYSAVKELDGRVIERAICAPELCGTLITDKARVYRTVLNNGSYNAIWRKCARAKCFDGRDYSAYYHVRHGEDLMQSLEILENAQSFMFIPEVLYRYRCNAGSVTQTIDYDERGVDNTVDKYVDEFVYRCGVLGEADRDALRDVRLDHLAIELRSRIRYCTSEEKALASLERLRGDEYVSEMLDIGYSAASGRGGVQRMLYRKNIALFKARKYKQLMSMDRLMVKLKG